MAGTQSDKNQMIIRGRKPSATCTYFFYQATLASQEPDKEEPLGTLLVQLLLGNRSHKPQLHTADGLKQGPHMPIISMSLEG